MVGIYAIIPFDNLYRRAYFVMHTFLVLLDMVLSVLLRFAASDYPFNILTFRIYHRFILIIKNKIWIETEEICFFDYNMPRCPYRRIHYVVCCLTSKYSFNVTNCNLEKTSQVCFTCI